MKLCITEPVLLKMELMVLHCDTSNLFGYGSILKTLKTPKG